MQLQSRQARAVRGLCPQPRGTRHSASRRVCVTLATAAPAADTKPTVYVPKSIEEVDNGKILGFGADLSEDHPGYHDEAYKQRRVMIANIARTHQIGQPIPKIDYTDEELRVWSTVYRELVKLYPQHACREFNDVFPRFHFREDAIPQLQDMDEVLQATTGWRIRPVAGLMHPRDFLNGLAFKYFHSTQYVRHPSKPFYTPEPDVCHELLGHVPMLAVPAYSAMAQAIGLASLGADEKLVWHLTKVYWYTVEFGVVREEAAIKAFGAGVLSSYGELQHMAEGGAALEPLDPFAPLPKMSYKDGYQRRYFVLGGFEEGAAQLQEYARMVREQREGA